MRLSSVSSLAAALVLATGSAQAALTVYTDRASFEVASAAAAVDTFDDLRAAFIPSPLLRSAGSFGYRVSAVGDFLPLASGPGEAWLTTISLVPVTLGSFSGGVTAAGGNFFATSFDGAVLDRSVTVLATDAGGTLSQTFTGAAPGGFIGFVSDQALVSLVISVAGPGAYVTLNDVALAAVPEPAPAFALLAGGALLLALGRRRLPAH
jgi:hypothetical protein